MTQEKTKSTRAGDNGALFDHWPLNQNAADAKR